MSHLASIHGWNGFDGTRLGHTCISARSHWQPGPIQVVTPGPVQVDIASAKAQDLITVTALKLQPRDTRELSPVALVKSVEQEIKGWAIAKPVLAARRLRKSGTRALRLYELTQVHDRLSSGTYRAPRGGLSRESHLVARANHTLDRDHNLWADVLPAD